MTSRLYPDVKAPKGWRQMMITLNKNGSSEKTDVHHFLRTDASGILAPKVIEGTSYDNKKQGDSCRSFF